MNWAPGFAEVIGGLKGVGTSIVEEFQSLQASWQSWAEREHNEDGTHSNITATSVTARSVQPNPDLATTSALGAVYDSTNNRRTGPWQAVHAWLATVYDTLTIGTDAAHQVVLDITSVASSAALRVSRTIVPSSDNAIDIGAAINPPGVSSLNRRWRHLAIAGTLFFGSGNSRLRSGTGTPEGVITGNVGDLFVRTDGGAGTSLYVKESGTGATGWAGK